jgi:hypothetical protein
MRIVAARGRGYTEIFSAITTKTLGVWAVEINKPISANNSLQISLVGEF